MFVLIISIVVTLAIGARIVTIVIVIIFDHLGRVRSTNQFQGHLLGSFRASVFVMGTPCVFSVLCRHFRVVRWVVSCPHKSNPPTENSKLYVAHNDITPKLLLAFLSACSFVLWMLDLEPNLEPPDPAVSFYTVIMVTPPHSSGPPGRKL
jgi:hypothetical protein